MRIVRLLTSRALAAGLMLSFVVVLVLSLISRGEIPGLEGLLADAEGTGPLGLVELGSSPLILLLWVLLTLAIVVATARQCRVAWRRMNRSSRPRPSSCSQLAADGEAVSRLRAHGWFMLPAGDPGDARLVRNPWSIWSGVVLHIGLVLTLVAAAVVTLTGSRVVVSTRIGEAIGPQSAPVAEVHGRFASELVLPAELRIRGVEPTYRQNGDLEQITSTLDDPAQGVTLSVAVNDVLSWRGLSVYQTQEVGPAYVVEFWRDGQVLGTETVEMLLSTPAGAPTYRDIELPWGPELLRARSVVSQSDSVTSTELRLRLEEQGEVLGEASLAEDRPVELGPYVVTLKAVTWWDRLIFVRERGVPVLFLGFMLIGIAALSMYAAPPREVYIIREAGRACISYRGSGFPGAERERERVWALTGASEEADG